jgi:hypothetical protein
MMGLSSRTVAVIAVACAVGLAGTATAANGTGSTTAPAAGTGGPGVVVQDPKAASDATISKLTIQRNTINGMLQKARQDRDVLKVLCLNDKLSQIDVTIRSAKQRKVSLDSAYQRGQSELANHEATIIEVYKGRGERLSAEANQCVGTDEGFIGQAVVTVDIDPNIVQDNNGTVGGGGFVDPWVQPVVPMSPTQ